MAELEPARGEGSPDSHPSLSTALEAALALEEEEGGDLPSQLLLQHLLDGRRKQKLLLSQLRVLCRVLGVLKTPQPPPSPAPSTLRQEVSEARSHWQGLKELYWEEVEKLGTFLTPTLAQLGRGQHLLKGLQKHQELLVKLCQARERRQQLQQRLQERSQQRLSRQGALEDRHKAERRAAAGHRLLHHLAGSQPATRDLPRTPPRQP